MIKERNQITLLGTIEEIEEIEEIERVEIVPGRRAANVWVREQVG